MPSPIPFAVERPVRHKKGKNKCHADCSHLAEADVVPVPVTVCDVSTDPSSTHTLPPLAEQRTHSLSQSMDVPSQGLGPSWFQHSSWFQHGSCSKEIQEILLHSRKLATHHTYLKKWTRFQVWCNSRQITPTSSTLLVVLDYMLDLKGSGLFLSSLKVHLAAMVTFHQQVEGYSIFSHPTTQRFLKGTVNLFPQPRHPTPTWDLNLVLKNLTRLPFVPMATCLLTHCQ